MTVLYMTPQESATTAALARAASARDIEVVRFTQDDDVFLDRAAHAYGGPKFMGRLRSAVDVAPIEPTDDWLAGLPSTYLRREVRLMPVSEASTNPRLSFVKAPREKDFEPGIYAGSELPHHGADDPPVIVSEIVTFTREYRLLVLDGLVRTGSRYLTSGHVDARPLDHDPDRDAVLAFARDLLDTVGDTLPSAVTVDVGWAVHADRDDAGWAVVEANMAWFSSIYACDPVRALDVILRAAGPAHELAESDRRFVRSVETSLVHE